MDENGLIIKNEQLTTTKKYEDGSIAIITEITEYHLETKILSIKTETFINKDGNICKGISENLTKDDAESDSESDTESKSESSE